MLSTGLREKLDKWFNREAWPAMRTFAAWYRRLVIPHVRIVAVVGSFGKTTTFRATASAIGQSLGHGPWRNLKSYVALSMLRIPPWRKHAVIEVGIATRGEMATYAALLRPDITIVTSIGSEHHTSFTDFQTTAHEKAHMVRALGTDGVAILNGDDPYVRGMAAGCRGRVVMFGFGESNQVRATDLSDCAANGRTFTLHTGKDRAEHRVETPLVARHSIYSLLSSSAAALELGIPTHAIISNIANFQTLDGRMQIVRLPNGAVILRDDFKSAIETVETAVETLLEMPARRRIAVLGDVTEPLGSQNAMYKSLGRRLGSVVDELFFVGMVHRKLASGAREGAAKVTNGHMTVQQIAGMLRDTLREGDVALIKGRFTERLERVSLLLAGRKVSCALTECNLKAVTCERCPHLARGHKTPRAAYLSHPAGHGAEPAAEDLSIT